MTNPRGRADFMRTLVWWAGVAGLLAIGVQQVGVVAQETTARRSRTTPTGAAVSDSDFARLEKRLDEIAATQAQILQKFDVVMEELRIIKIRATTD